MSEIAKKIAEDLKNALKNRDQARTSILRMITSSAQYAAIEKREKELEDKDILKIIQKKVKEHLDSIESFKKGNRPDLVDKETKELEILRSYLPSQASEEKIEQVVRKIVSQAGASSRADFGKVMKLTMEELQESADGKAVSKIVQKALSN